MEPPLSGWVPVVKPAPRYHETRPVLAVTLHAILTDDGQTFTREDNEPRQELRRLFRESPPSIIAADRALPILAELDTLFSDEERFQFEIFAMPREAFNPEWTARGARVLHDTYVVNRVGLRATRGHDENGRGKKEGRWHLLLDCVDLTGGLPEDVVDAPTRVQALMQWGRTMKRLVREFEVRARPTNGGMASQILRAPRFYPRARRRVPRQSNENTRPGLRGNHYDWTNIDPATTYENVLEIDQRNAHHHSASDIALPSSDTLFARLSYRVPRRPAGAGLMRGTRGFEQEIQRCGMFLVTLSTRGDHLPFKPPLPDVRPVLICSNEVPYLESAGLQIRTIIASWTGEPEPEGEGISAYADYCLEMSSRVPPAEWRIMKRTLLTLYGVLGAKPKPVRRMYRRSKHELESLEIGAGKGTLTVKATEPHDSDPFTANVVQRAMIEAETAWRSVNLANELALAGHEVLAIYADALYVRTETPPLLAPPWRIKHEMVTASFPRTGVVFGALKGGGALSKVPGGLRKEIAEKRAIRDRVANTARMTYNRQVEESPQSEVMH